MRERYRGYARKLLQMRKARRTVLDEGLVSGPSWDLMVALYSLDKEACLIGRLGELADVPLSTALRQLQNLEEQRLIRRMPSPFDGRAVEIHLTDEGREAMDRILAAGAF